VQDAVAVGVAKRFGELKGNGGGLADLESPARLFDDPALTARFPSTAPALRANSTAAAPANALPLIAMKRAIVEMTVPGDGLRIRIVVASWVGVPRCGAGLRRKTGGVGADATEFSSASQLTAHSSQLTDS
jgi:hypothetical protein